MTIVREVGRCKHGHRLVLCRCSCGAEKTVDIGSLRGNKNNTASCGCYLRELLRSRCTKHGLTGTPTHKTWLKMLERCFNPKCREFRLYGGRGVTVCAEWQKDFLAFLTYVGSRPSAGHSIDRWPNQNGNYEPGNVRWATRTEQNRNRRDNVLLEYDGERMTVAEWAERSGLSYATLYSRLKGGWSVRDAITTPAKPLPRKWSRVALAKSAKVGE